MITLAGTMRRATLFFAATTFGAAVLGAATGCGGTTKAVVTAPPPPPPVAVDADPMALMPAGALLAARLDATMIANSTFGGDLVALMERVLPFSREIDFEVRRDLRLAWIGSYSYSGADSLAVLTGRFQADKIEAAVQRGVTTARGPIVASTYAGRRIYTVANVGFTLLTPQTALVGTEAAMRRALDRIQAGTVRREIPPWMSEWTDQPAYPVVMAADASKQSFGKMVVSFVPWISGVQYVRLRGRFSPDSSFGVSGALTYPDAARAETAAQGLAVLPKSVQLLAIAKAFGVDPVLRTLTVNPSGNDVQVGMVVDERQMRLLLRLLSDAVGGVVPALPTGSPTTPSTPSSGGGTTL